jgi:hypothetical protein
MYWLAVAVTAIPLVIVAALAIPVQLDVSAEWTDRLRGHVRLRWWFAVIDLQGPGAAKSRPPRPTPPATGRGRAALAALRTQGLISRVLGLVRDLLRQIHVRHFQLRARYGLGDPADTGQLCGTLAPVLALASARGLDVQCLPEFTEVALDGSCNGTILVRPLSVVAVVIAFLCSPPVWRAARTWRRAS